MCFELMKNCPLNFSKCSHQKKGGTVGFFDFAKIKALT